MSVTAELNLSSTCAAFRGRFIKNLIRMVLNFRKFLMVDLSNKGRFLINPSPNLPNLSRVTNPPKTGLN